MEHAYVSGIGDGRFFRTYQAWAVSERAIPRLSLDSRVNVSGLYPLPMLVRRCYRSASLGRAPIVALEPLRLARTNARTVPTC